MREVVNMVSFLVVIAGRKQKKELLKAISENGGRALHIEYGQGSVKASYIQDAFGFVPEEKKVVISCLLSNRRADDMLKMLAEQFDFNKPNTGIAFTIPVNKLAF